MYKNSFLVRFLERAEEEEKQKVQQPEKSRSPKKNI
jgi:hypothetical protein